MSTKDEIVLEAISGRRAGPKGYLRANCPFCLLTVGKQDRKQCLSLNTTTGEWRCFRCDERGRLPGDYERDVPKMPRCATVEVPPLDLPPGFEPLWREPGLSASVFEDARRYLDSRKVKPHVIDAARIGATMHGKFSGRIVVPIFRRDGRMVGYVGRVWTKKAKRTYLYGEGTDRSTVLYNEAALDVRTDKPVIVVEGVFDTFPFWPDAVAVLGKPAHGQLDSLIKARRPVCVALDGDAWREGVALALTLRHHGQRAGYIRLPPKTDPDEMPDYIMKEAVNCLEGGPAHGHA